MSIVSIEATDGLNDLIRTVTDGRKWRRKKHGASCTRLLNPQQRGFQKLRVALQQHGHKRARFTQERAIQLIQSKTPDVQVSYLLNFIARLYGVLKEATADGQHLCDVEARVVALQREADSACGRAC